MKAKARPLLRLRR